MITATDFLFYGLGLLFMSIGIRRMFFWDAEWESYVKRMERRGLRPIHPYRDRNWEIYVTVNGMIVFAIGFFFFVWALWGS